MSFDQVVPSLLRACESIDGFVDAAEQAIIMRDVRGRVRLVVKPKASATFDFQKASVRLVSELGKWFEGPVIVHGPGKLNRLANALLALEREQVQLEYERAPGETVKAASCFGLVERRLSKLSWLAESSLTPPWPLRREKPVIVTFFSFKGGVGRTTLAAAVALQLAQRKKRVLAIDLDLEAPGLGTLLGASEGPGVLDAIMNVVGAGHASVDGLISTAAAIGPEGAFVEVLPAGALERGYFEKLARLDFVGGLTTGPSPVADALCQILKVVAARRPAPDFILLDARAGLHDLAGLSLQGLAHIDVLVARDSEQSYLGLDLVIELLGQRPEESFLAIMVHSLAAADRNSPEAIRSEQQFRDRTHAAFMQHVYSDEGDAAPSVTDIAAHTPWVIRSNDRLHRFVSFDSIREVLLGTEYSSVAERVIELATTAEDSS